jgi:hypothetical protein
MGCLSAVEGFARGSNPLASFMQLPVAYVRQKRVL